ncbi:peptidase inhibitor family I36 protein [Kitasatospora sp. NPDC088783]|uniref:peptidase inhibitor family I36 protein n=1 Tax=Kitasatospora sp. NPDC088783 TaxID=3364077 RepID=UPI0037F28610
MTNTSRALVRALAAGALALSVAAAAVPAHATGSGTVQDSRPAIAALSTAQRGELQKQVEQQIKASKVSATQTAANEITYADGTVMSFPLPGQGAAPAYSKTPTASLASDWYGCPDGWYCFYADAGMLGRRLQFSYVYDTTPVDFNNYGFRDQTTSWVDNTNWAHIVVDNDAGGGNWQLLWTESSRTLSSNVGWANDSADRFWSIRE